MRKEENTTHRSLKFVTILAQCFALFPLNGIISSNVTDLKFSWISFNFLYTLILILIVSFIIIMDFVRLIFNGLKFTYFVEDIFYISSLCTIILFVRLARVWPKLMREWVKVDKIMERNYGFPKELNRRLKMTTTVIMLIALVEHQLALANNVANCSKQYKSGFNSTVYYKYSYRQIFVYVPYSIYIAILAQFATIWTTFSWSFNNLFIILMSTALALRFKQITIRLKQREKKGATLYFWTQIREDYDRLCNLCKLLDSSISLIILVSFATNLFFILAQLYYSLRKMSTAIEKIYFYYSFGFLISRTVAVSLYGAWVNDESRRLVVVLNSVPSCNYNDEIKRLLLQISFDNAALTGNKMFKITRGLILNIAGAIVTYELVLIQFIGTDLQEIR